MKLETRNLSLITHHFSLYFYTLNAVRSTLYYILTTNVIGQSVNWRIGKSVNEGYSNMPLKLGMGDIIRLKKKHPCGSFHWEITRTGIDIGLKCLCCGRKVLVPRVKLEKKIREIIPRD